MILVIGEVYIDYTLPSKYSKCKLRLGGIVHACRGLWALNKPYSAAIICPSFVKDEVVKFLKAHNCTNVIILGEINGSPNVISIRDPEEIGDQNYDLLLKDDKSITLYDLNDHTYYDDILLFPGKFEINKVLNIFNCYGSIHLDIAYDIDDLSDLNNLSKKISFLTLSTSSPLFDKYGNENLDILLEKMKILSPDIFILKENRGGSRVFNFIDNTIKYIPAFIEKTKNSVGVGDVYTASVVANKNLGWEDAAWIASICAKNYSQTTFPDDFKRDLQRELSLTLIEIKSLGKSGCSLPWHNRKKYNIYFAAPDFSYIDRQYLDEAISALEYHNFCLRRPILENGELNNKSPKFDRLMAFNEDIALLEKCDVLFGVPINRDPGTLVEIGMAFKQKIPIITYDPYNENNNNMLLNSSTYYSCHLDSCLDSLFLNLSKLGLKTNG